MTADYKSIEKCLEVQLIEKCALREVPWGEEIRIQSARQRKKQISMEQLLALILFIYLMYQVMKYFFKLLFGVSVATHSINNILSHFALKPLRGILGFLTGSSTKGMMGHFEQRSFLNFSNKGLVLNGADKRLSAKESFNHMGS